MVMLKPEVYDPIAGWYNDVITGRGNDIFKKEIHMLWTISVMLMILWILGLGTGFTMGSSIHIFFAAAVALLVVSLSQEVIINQKLRNVLRGRRPKPDRKNKDSQPIIS
jgi:hypothetical protein